MRLPAVPGPVVNLYPACIELIVLCVHAPPSGSTASINGYDIAVVAPLVFQVVELGAMAVPVALVPPVVFIASMVIFAVVSAVEFLYL